MEVLLVSIGIVALAEIGDKKQIATVALAKKLPVRAVHVVAALVFAALGVGALVIG